MSRSDLQLDAQGHLRHFLSIEGLKRKTLIEILDVASSFLMKDRAVKKVPLLRGKTIINLFFETSTRTRNTFELAAKRLSADVMSINMATSASANKGESMLDMLHNLESMHCDMFVVRHAQSGAAHFIARHVAPHVSVVNAGDGRHAHPTQAMLDMLTIRQHKEQFADLRVAIVGDVLHSRVARSEIHALTTLGTGEVRVIGPKTLMPPEPQALGVHVFHDLKEGLEGVDVVVALRLQRERMDSALLPSEREYFRRWGLTEEALAVAKPDVIVMHPGPINRGVEIHSTVADGPNSVILEQVGNGIAVRMAIMSLCLGRNPSAEQESP